MNETETPKRSSRLMIIGFVVVILLIGAGLFLPPISLGERLGLGGNDDTAVTPDSQTDTPADGVETAISSDAPPTSGDAPPTSGDAPPTTLTKSDTPPAAPTGVTWSGDVYTVAYGASGDAAVPLPTGATAPSQLDLFGWDGSTWSFLPSRLDTTAGTLILSNDAQPQALAVGQVQTAPATELALATAVLPGQELPLELLPLLAEITAGTLTLSGPTLQGEPVALPTGPYLKLLRVTNTGIIADTASLSALLSDTAGQTTHIADLVSRAVSGGFNGLTLDYQGASTAEQVTYTTFVRSLAEALHAQNLLLAVTLALPTGTANAWNTGGQDWAALGQVADMVYLQLPLNPAAYADGSTADQVLTTAVRLIDRRKLTAQISAQAISGLGEAYLELTNDAALSNFGDLQFVSGSPEITPETPVELALSGTAGPLEWDGNSLTYQYSYDEGGQTHRVWLGNEAALAYRARLAGRYNLHGLMITGLGSVSNGAGYAAALASVQGTVAAPQPTDAAIVWTVRDADGNVLASDTGSNLTFAWDGKVAPGTYTVNVDFALGDNVSTLGTADIVVQETAVAEVAQPTETPATAGTTAQPAPPATPAPATGSTAASGANGVINTGANVRQGPGLGYGTLANGITAGNRVTLIGRSEDATWINIILPDGQTEGWVFAPLITPDTGVVVANLPVVAAPPLVATNPDSGSGSGTGSGTPAAPPPVVAPITNSGFELGGQAFGAPYGMMSYSGMTWLKRQLKWSPGTPAEAAAGLISEAHAAGFKILLSIPGDRYPSQLPDFNAYTAFLRSVAALPDPPDAIEIWNEMNIDAEWPAGQISASTYVNSMLAPAYNAIKGANSRIMVVSGAPAPTGYFGGGCGSGGCDDAPYVAAMAAAGAASYMDCLGIHYNEGIISPNQTSGDPRTDHYTRYFWGMVNAYWNAFGGARPLCFTELGYLTAEGYGALPGGFAWAGNVTVAQQAQWLAEAASLSASSGKVRLMVVWNVDSATWGDDPQAGYAIIRPGGSCPACEALRQVTGGR